MTEVYTVVGKQLAKFLVYTSIINLGNLLTLLDMLNKYGSIVLDFFQIVINHTNW